MNHNTNLFAIGDIIAIKGYEELRVGVILQIYTFHLPHDKEIKYSIYWFKAGSDPFLYNEIVLMPKG